MNKLRAFINLDMLTVKPYLTAKILLIYTAIAVMITVATKNTTAVLGILMMLGCMCMSYPFAIGEKSGMDALYISLSVKRGTVVLGRYIYAMIMEIAALVIGIVVQFAVIPLIGQGVNTQETIYAAAATFGIFTALQAILLPLYFKLGYTKTKLVVYIIPISIAAIIGMFSLFLKDAKFSEAADSASVWLNENTSVAVVSLAAVWIIIITVSYIVSLAFYKKREF